jgi:hypothetical protein
VDFERSFGVSKVSLSHTTTPRSWRVSEESLKRDNLSNIYI